MKELLIENLHKTYGTKELFAGIDLSIRTGDRVGLIGPNGTGKSSLLRVIADEDTYDAGTIEKPHNYRISYLAQEPQLDQEQGILETIFESPAPIVQLVRQYEQTRLQLAADPQNEALQAHFLQLSEAMTQEQGWDLETKARRILNRLGITDLTQRVKDISGGQQKRVGIAQVLIEEPDLLILDEPTNHLDIEAIQWLEGYLSTYQGALLLVTHDRYFLTRVVTRIVELTQGQLTEYVGNYEDYLEQRTVREEQLSQARHRQNRLYQQELAWMRSGVRARGTRQKARIERFDRLEAAVHSRPQDSQALEFDFTQQRIGRQVMEFAKMSVAINAQLVIEDFTQTLVAGDRIGIIGPNGVGKTTLLNTLAGLHPLAAGSYQRGQTVRLAYYRQMDEELPDDERILTYLMRIADDYRHPDGSRADASQLLEQFNFPRSHHGHRIGSLSGGEKRRLYLLSLLIQAPNVLLLDEPTNNLDIETLTVLEHYLEEFVGVVIIVSHDRYFLDRTVTQLLELQGAGKFAWFWGSYTEYLAHREAKRQQEKQTATSSAPAKQPRTKSSRRPRLSYHERQEWEQLPDQIDQLETQSDTLTTQMEQLGNQPEELMATHAELEAVETALLELYERYEQLSQKES